MKYILALVLTFSTHLSFADHGFLTSVTTLATADVRQVILASNESAYDFVIQNPAANIVSIFLGGSNVTTSGVAQGIEIVPGASIALSSTGAFQSSKLLTATKIFLISTGTSVPVVIGRIVK